MTQDSVVRLPKDDDEIFIAYPLFKGRIRDAEYLPQSVPSYQGNPLLEALPPEYQNDQEVIKALMQKPDFSIALRELSARDRIHCVGDIEDQLFQPLSHHVGLQLKMSRMIRRGYVMRNPLTPGFYRELQDTLGTISSFTERLQGPRRPKALGFNLIGPSGIGKSYSLESLLYLYPQVIKHRHYKDRHLTLHQLVWLKLDCPFDGSLKALAFSFFEAVDDLLGTNYSRAYTQSRRLSLDDLLRAMARVASLHFLGTLIIDEIQVLRAMRGDNSEKMLNFFVNLVNTIGVPVLLVGTDRARHLFEQKPRQARRGTGQGSEVWHLMRNDSTWEVFLTSLFKYQYVKHPVALTPELRNAFYEETQGITDLVVKLYVQSQIRAIRTGHETLTVRVVQSVALDSFQMLRPIIMALRNGDKRALAELEDIYPFWREEYAQLGLGEERPTLLTKSSHTTSSSADRTQHSHAIVDASTMPTTLGEQEQEETVSTAEISKRPQRPRRSKAQILPADSLMAIVANGKAQDIPPYEALKQAGYIFNSATHLAGEKT